MLSTCFESKNHQSTKFFLRCYLSIFVENGQPTKFKAFLYALFLVSISVDQQRTIWSGRQDSNLRPPVPKTGALPGCATPRLNAVLNKQVTFGKSLFA